LQVDDVRRVGVDILVDGRLVTAPTRDDAALTAVRGGTT
jgi:hypothetical protein